MPASLITQAISSLPDAPSRINDAPAVFASKADASLTAQVTMVEQLQDWTTQANALATQANSDATTATTKAAEALASANAADASADAALISANASAASAVEAGALVEKYLGALATDPTTDKAGGALTSGDWYVNTASGLIRAYTGSAWVNGVGVVTGVSSVNGQTGDVAELATTTDVTNAVAPKANSANPSFTGSVTESVYNLTGTVINPANGTIQYKTLTGNTTFTESLSDGQSVTLMLNPSTYTTTWFTATWIGSKASVAPTLIASVYNCITFFQIAGVVYGKYEGRV